MKYRITHPDPHNWCIEEFQEGGSTISRGRFAGQETQARWKAPTAFYRTLEDAAKGLLNRAAGDAMLTGEAQSTLDAIGIAEKRVMETLAAMGQQERPDRPCDENCARRAVPAAECDCSRAQE